MGLFNKMLGYPDADPTGDSRDLFEKVGKQTMTMFFRGDVERASNHVEMFMEKQINEFGRDHPDVGRAFLLSASMLTFIAQYESAIEMCSMAQTILKTRDENDIDRTAAEFLYEGLDQITSGKRSADDGYLISEDTVIGKWLWRLRD